MFHWSVSIFFKFHILIGCFVLFLTICSYFRKGFEPNLQQFCCGLGESPRTSWQRVPAVKVTFHWYVAPWRWRLLPESCCTLLVEFVIAKLYPWAVRCPRTVGALNRTGLTLRCSVALTTFLGHADLRVVRVWLLDGSMVYNNIIMYIKNKILHLLIVNNIVHTSLFGIPLFVVVAFFWANACFVD